MKILVLGIKGMLGSMVYSYLRGQSGITVAGTYRDQKEGFYFANDPLVFEFSASEEVENQMKQIMSHFSADYIINCIGVIKPYCMDQDMKGVKNAILVNALFPHLLGSVIKEIAPDTRILQIATDCVYSGKKG
ncbi:MAG: NAD-dependent epimerase/dehydratase family protein, partial [Bacteroidota bacterium]